MAVHFSHVHEEQKLLILWLESELRGFSLDVSTGGVAVTGQLLLSMEWLYVEGDVGGSPGGLLKCGTS
jgi:hypothetical protein